jgi:hypothetical protein
VFLRSRFSTGSRRPCGHLSNCRSGRIPSVAQASGLRSLRQAGRQRGVPRTRRLEVVPSGRVVGGKRHARSSRGAEGPGLVPGRSALLLSMGSPKLIEQRPSPQPAPGAPRPRTTGPQRASAPIRGRELVQVVRTGRYPGPSSGVWPSRSKMREDWIWPTFALTGHRAKSTTVAAVCAGCPSQGPCPPASTSSRACGISSVSARATETPPSGSRSPHITSVGTADDGDDLHPRDPRAQRGATNVRREADRAGSAQGSWTQVDPKAGARSA